jgi:hypothetical protein
MGKITPELENLLALLPAEKREGARKEIEGGFLRQDEFSRKMNELTENDKRREVAYAEGKTWVENNRTYYKEALAQRDEAVKKAKELEERAANLGKPAPVEDPEINVDDPIALAKALRKAREDAAAARADAASLSKIVTDVAEKLTNGQLVTLDQFETEGGKRLEAFSKATMDVMQTLQRGQKEYGLDINRDELLKKAEQFGGSLEKAYEDVTAPARLEKLKKDIRDEVTKELEGKYQSSATPLAPGDTPLALGPLQQRVFQVANPSSTIDPNIPADGSGRLAHAIAAEMRAEGLK